MVSVLFLLSLFQFLVSSLTLAIFLGSHPLFPSSGQPSGKSIIILLWRKSSQPPLFLFADSPIRIASHRSSRPGTAIVHSQDHPSHWLTERKSRTRLMRPDDIGTTTRHTPTFSLRTRHSLFPLIKHRALSTAPY